MNYWSILEMIAIALAVAGVAKGVTLILASVTAERDWNRAVEQLSDDQVKIITDFMLEGQLLGETTTWLRQKYLAAAFRDLVTELKANERLPERSAKVIESALLQPSEAGRQAYADKLAREALERRTMANAG